MSPVPEQLTNRWENRPEVGPEQGTVYWHMLLGHNPQVGALADQARRRLEGFSGLHMTPTRWLHITTLIAGSQDQISDESMNGMLAVATDLLADTPPVTINLGKILYFPEGIVFSVQPGGVLEPVLEVVQAATHALIGTNGADGDAEPWLPHVTLCYSTDQQPAAPIIAALGKELPSCEVSIDRVSLVVQRGPERSWDWHPVGSAVFGGSGDGSVDAGRPDRP